MSHLTIVILLFECCFVTVIDCIDCSMYSLFIILYFIGACLLRMTDSCSIKETFGLILAKTIMFWQRFFYFWFKAFSHCAYIN